MLVSNQTFLRPDPLLNDLIDHYWFSDVMNSNDAKGSDHSQIQLPDLFTDWYFDYQDTKHDNLIDGVIYKTSPSVLVTSSRVDRILSYINFSIPFRGLRVRFKPACFYKYFHISPSEFRLGMSNTEDVFGSEIKGLHERVENANNHNQRKRLLDIFFIEKLKSVNKNVFETFGCENLLDTIHYQKGKIRIESLSAIYGKSSRTIERYFKYFFGLNPKEACENIRFRNVIREILLNDQINWNDLSFKYGYYDQSHMINEIKKATSKTPEWLLNCKNKEYLLTNGCLLFLTSQYIKEMINYLENNTRLLIKENNGWLRLEEMTIAP